MAAFAPDAIMGCWRIIRERMPRAQLSGILANKPGYHNSRNRNSPSNYSVQRADDRVGNAHAASALDITMNPTDMRLMSQRLLDANNRRDPRVMRLRSFFGTIDGRNVIGRDFRDNRFVTSDASHLWHVHISGYRRWATDAATWRDVADVCTGRTSSGGGTPAPTPPPQEADPMPKQITLNLSNRMAFAANQWRTLTFQNWAPQNMSGGQSAVLPAAGGMFICTLDLDIDRLPLDNNIWVRVQTLDRQGKQRALFRNAEIRGTSGMSALSYSRVGSVPRDTNIRVQVCADVAMNITRAQWRVLHW